MLTLLRFEAPIYQSSSVARVISLLQALGIVRNMPWLP